MAPTSNWHRIQLLEHDGRFTIFPSLDGDINNQLEECIQGSRPREAMIENLKNEGDVELIKKNIVETSIVSYREKGTTT